MYLFTREVLIIVYVYFCYEQRDKAIRDTTLRLKEVRLMFITSQFF